MYQNSNLHRDALGHFVINIGQKPFKILQLTDLHLGFGWLSRKRDKLALEAVATLIRRTQPDLIALTGDCIFPFLPKSGTLNNLKQAKALVDFMDNFEIPYTFVFGNHDIEMGSKGDKNAVSEIIESGKYSIFSRGDTDLTGMGNYLVKLQADGEDATTALVFLDSNMYRDGWFFSGFDCIREDQTRWCLTQLEALKAKHASVKALCFFHMPLPEFKIAYEKMKLGDKLVTYNFGSVGEADDYFGISKYQPDFFEKIAEQGIVKGIFCGHDHYNTLSLTYKGIMMTYGMSIDYLGYKNIHKKYVQRGGTVITVYPNGDFEARPEPLTTVVSQFVRGAEK